jgi:PAS domain S-box-containing protein
MDGGDDNPKEPRSRTHLRELAQARDFLTKVIEASPDAIVAAECTGDIVLFNGAAEAILGWSADEAVGMHVRNLYPPGDAERIMEMLRSQEHGGPGRLVSRREVVCSKDGAWRWRSGSRRRPPAWSAPVERRSWPSWPARQLTSSTNP